MSDLRGGLAKVFSDTPVRGGYLEGLAGVTRNEGPFLRGTLGLRPLDNVSAYVTAEWNRVNPWAGIGLEYRF